MCCLDKFYILSMLRIYTYKLTVYPFWSILYLPRVHVNIRKQVTMAVMDISTMFQYRLPLLYQLLTITIATCSTPIHMVTDWPRPSCNALVSFFWWLPFQFQLLVNSCSKFDDDDSYSVNILSQFGYTFLINELFIF